MQTTQTMPTVDALLKADAAGEFASFLDRLPPLLKPQAHLFGQHEQTEEEKTFDMEKLRELFGDTQTRFDRRKTDRRLDQSRTPISSRVSSDRRRKNDLLAGYRADAQL
ncbi:hypothetical protein [Undibacterium sp. TJN19]|uniref:hypothetical protein n=1 Tax=Undibacterium sp. TJN19 TaxID=3413055 RepID=UPI003BEF51C6